MSSITTPQQITGPQTYAIGSPIGSTSAAEPEGITFSDVMRILKQRKLTIIVTSVVLYILVVVATLLIGRYAPTYTSEAIFELEPPRGGDILMPTEGEVNTAYMEQLLMTEAAKIKSMQLMMDIVARPEIKATRYYKWYESNVQEAADGLQKDLYSAPIKDTWLIKVALACRDKEEARLIVQSVVERYLAIYRDAAKEETIQQSESLKNTLGDLNDKLALKRDEIRRLRENANIPAMEMRRMEARQQVVALRVTYDELNAAVASLDSQLAGLKNVDPARLPLTAEQELLVEADPILRFWRSQVENLDVELASLAKQLGPNHRNVVILRQRRQGYYEKEVAKREELMAKVRARQIEMLRQQRAQTNSMREKLHEQIEEVQADERDLDHNMQQYQEMTSDEERLTDQIGQIELKLTEAQHLMNRDTNQLRLHLRTAPMVAIEPTRPMYVTYLLGGLVLALAGGVGLAFLRELTDQAVRTPIDVARFCRLSVLGCIPLLEDEEADVEEFEDAVRLAPQSLVAEAFRRTRTNLQFSGPVESQRSLLITSPSPGDGKTAVAINLATTLAHGNLKVLLIDCNFRRPSIREIYPGSRPEGLSNVLIAEGKLKDYVTKTDLPTLDVLSCGPMPPTPAELLGSVQMRELIKEAVEAYDRVILDGPPTLLVSDATVMAMLVDGVILVARAEENSRGVLKRAREQLEGINARVIGAILNGVRTRAGGYFKKQYREFYDYTSDETIPEILPEPPDASGTDSNEET